MKHRFRATASHSLQDSRNWTRLDSWRWLPLVFALLISSDATLMGQSKSEASSSVESVAKALGTIKSVQSDSIAVSSESGSEIVATFSSSTKILRVPPGEKDLKNAVPLQAQDLQPGDRVLVRGKQSSDGHSISAVAVIVMKQTDVATKNDQQRVDWQKRSVGGLVTGVDAGTNSVTISSSAIGKKQNIVVHLGNETVLRRYAPGSVKFDDAKRIPASQFMVDVKTGDQLRARGVRNQDGTEITAEEIVAGSFRNIAGKIQAIDIAAKTIIVRDEISKTAVTVNISADSQIKTLSPEIAQRIAARLKMTGGDPANTAGRDPGQDHTAPNEQTAAAGGEQTGSKTRGRSSDGSAGAGGNGPPDLQRMLGHLPSNSILDLKSGDAVMMVATEEEGADKATAITLLAGVEPILTAAPSRSTSSLLSPWSLSAPSGDSESTQ